MNNLGFQTGNISEITIWKYFLKGSEQSFRKVRGCRKKFVEAQEEVFLEFLCSFKIPIWAFKLFSQLFGP